MNRDLAVSAFSPDFAFENKNLRLSTNEDNTLLSWVNEKGTLLLDIYAEDTNNKITLNGTCIGTAVLNDYLVLFSTGIKDSYPDCIYRLKYNDIKQAMECTVLYSGNLHFDINHPIETLVSFESEVIQKVYWTDGVNQPRVINIHNTYGINNNSSYNPFDFVPELALNETVTVEKLLGANGTFAPGVIQYAFTYYIKYGQESCIFYVSPLYYISYRDRGAAADNMVKNAFKITVKDIDTHFDYLRIYSIHRTSLNDTPIAKRVQDISIKELFVNKDGKYDVTYIDTGVNGNSIDPTELLYKGGEILSAQTIEQKDNTLFLGNIAVTRKFIDKELGGRIVNNVKSSLECSTRTIYPTLISATDYIYANQLTSYTSFDTSDRASVPCGGFKRGNVYRLGLQLQDKNGKWSNPVFIEDKEQTSSPTMSVENQINLPIFKGKLTKDYVNALINNGYRKVRSLVVFPSIQDRRVICQGIINPTLCTDKHKEEDKDLQAQSSWFFRTSNKGNYTTGKGYSCPTTITKNSKLYLPYTSKAVNAPYYDPNGTINIRQVEIQGEYNDDNKFRVNYDLQTFHSPDIEFDDSISVMDFANSYYRRVGTTDIEKTFSDIDIQTESPTINGNGSGFIHKSFSASNMQGIISGLFYDDFIVDDNSTDIQSYKNEKSPCKWLVYLWNKSGSLNNDINRPSDKGVQSAVLRKKVVSNLRFGGTTAYAEQAIGEVKFTKTPQIFSSDQATIVKVGNDVYMGNIDTMITPDSSDGMYFACGNGSNDFKSDNVSTDFTSEILYKTFSENVDTQENQGIWKLTTTGWTKAEADIGNEYLDLVLQKGFVRMKYKSTPHLVCTMTGINCDNNWQLPVMEVTRKLDENTIFGGKSNDALKENIWLPCGEPVSLKEGVDIGFEWSYGDTYFQRWDCLKTYPFTQEDINQVVEIGSFMLETYVNIDGRYDRNRGQINNLNMSPRNFNLYNPIYSQVDNFFSYKVLDEDDYKNVNYPNQITWSLTKNSGSDVDLWANITLASVLELDGDKNGINELVRFNNQLFAFQDTGISQILYNESTQISSTEGVPIEIANSGKVQGKRYLSNTVGCSNKWSMVTTPIGIYFMDNIDKGIYLFNGQLQNISVTKGFNAWCKQAMPDNSVWEPVGFNNFKTCYDKKNQDILFIDKNNALAFSEKLNTFTSFYDYGLTPYLENVNSKGIWVKNQGDSIKLYEHNAGSYCNFFNEQKPYWTTVVCNPEPLTDKIFTNLELRASIEDEGVDNEKTKQHIPYVPFDSIETWDEYQYGITGLLPKTGYYSFMHNTGDSLPGLKRKFRIWRSDIPRAMQSVAMIDIDALERNVQDVPVIEKDVADIPFNDNVKKSMDRMRNTWIYLKLKKQKDTDRKAVIHDITIDYYN